MTNEERVTDSERRMARDDWRRAGGSQKRPLKSFKTDAEKKAARLEHAERIHETGEALRDVSAFRDWLASLELNPDVSPLNAALISVQVGPEICGTAAYWKRNGYKVRKGETAAAWITGPMFYPRAAFTVDQADAGDLAAMAGAADPLEQLPEPVEALHARYCAALDADRAKGACEAVAEIVRPQC